MSQKRAKAKRKAAAKPLPPAAAPADALRDAVRRILPAAFRDGQLQPDILAKVLGPPDPAPDRYRFEWAGKAAAMRKFAAPPGGDPRPGPPPLRRLLRHPQCVH